MSTYYKQLKKKSKRKYIRSLGVLCIGLGVLFFLYFLFPVVSYQLFLAHAFSDTIEVPVPKYLVVKGEGVRGLLSQGFASLTKNFSDARNWYPSLPANLPEEKAVRFYYLSIPKLKIQNATVSTIDYDLSKHLVQYFGTSLPGKSGTAVIFGHSTIPAWFDPGNYEKIFATLHTLKIGDEITATVNAKSYKYKVFSILITSPDDTNMFSQSYDTSYITLVTCTPPGTVWKRLIVRASLE